MKKLFFIIPMVAALFMTSCDTKDDPADLRPNVTINANHINSYDYNGVTFFDTIRTSYPSNDMSLTFGIVSESVNSVNLKDCKTNESRDISLPFHSTFELEIANIPDTINYVISWNTNIVNYQLVIYDSASTLKAKSQYSN